MSKTERVIEMEHEVTKPRQPTPIFVLSGGTGASGELLTHTVLAQFSQVNVPITIYAHLHEPQQVMDAVSQAEAAGGVIVHTMVNEECRRTLMDLADQKGLFHFDLAGPLLAHLSQKLGQEPLGQPGLYRQLREAYYKRIEAIEFTVAHDDGKRPEGLAEADLILLGVSRVGKTPLSIYLSMLGWKVANIPVVQEIPLPDELFDVEQRRVFGLTIEPNQLMHHRHARESSLGIDRGAYFDRASIVEELRAAHHLFYKHHYTVIDVTNKPIESSGEEIITRLTS